MIRKNKIVCFTKRIWFAIAVISLGIWLGSCGGGKSSSGSGKSETQADNQLKVSPQALAKAEQTFVATCASCHGEGGKGDGPVSKALTPPPRNLTSPEWQNSVEDEYIAKIIQYGGAGVGKSIAMPNNPAIAADKELLNALVAYVRSLKN